MSSRAWRGQSRLDGPVGAEESGQYLSLIPERSMRQLRPLAIGFLVVATATLVARAQRAPFTRATSWDARNAATYLDGRMAWWLKWPTAARDHGTSCVSCHTALPFALARPALRATLADTAQGDAERRMVENVVTRVRAWKDVEPFYPDQTRGLPKTSESRGTEAVLNALVLARRDAAAAALSDDARLAFDNMWSLQFRNGALKGAWAWLNFQNEPWEANGSAFLGATLAAIAVGDAPGGYAVSAGVQDRVTALRAYVQRNVDTTHLLNRAMALWASGELPGLLTAAQRQSIVDAAVAVQQGDGGWSASSLGPWKRGDGTPLETQSDGYATGLVVLALERAGLSRTDARVRRGIDWLNQHQDSLTGAWSATSLNKNRDPRTDVGKFMSDAATAYAVLALTARP
jgi:squalene-hopene/tetraprenyl-beta-curcumene cyclase